MTSSLPSCVGPLLCPHVLVRRRPWATPQCVLGRHLFQLSPNLRTVNCLAEGVAPPRLLRSEMLQTRMSGGRGPAGPHGTAAAAGKGRPRRDGEDGPHRSGRGQRARGPAERAGPSPRLTRPHGGIMPQGNLKRGRGKVPRGIGAMSGAAGGLDGRGGGDGLAGRRLETRNESLIRWRVVPVDLTVDCDTVVPA